MITLIEGTCQYRQDRGQDDPITGEHHPDIVTCDRPATHFAADNGDAMGCYCEEHAEVVGQGSAEYLAVCPNCRCHFGVG
jgi:hypothetical protein